MGKEAAAPARLLCFPYAGGGPAIFRSWPSRLAPAFEVYAFHAPGRETRILEEPVAEIATLVTHAVRALAELPGKPLVLFGHSLGAVLAYETARLLSSHGKQPDLLVVSGRRAPQFPPARPPISHLPEGEFIEAVRRLNGTPAGVLENEELRELVLPSLRADFHLADTYQPLPGPRLSIPVLALRSHDDDHVDEPSVEAWAGVTSGAFETHAFPGDHFYLNTHGDALIAYVREAAMRRFAPWKTGTAPSPG